jgi:LPXTG-motif cell wall-anchored protein
MTRLITVAALLTAVSGFAFAGTVSAPEIDASTGVAGIALVSGALLVLRARRRK